jgi:hypothetical protein
MVDIGQFLIFKGERYFEGDYIEFEALNPDGTRCECYVKGKIVEIDTAHDSITIYIKDCIGNISSYSLSLIFDDEEGLAR